MPNGRELSKSNVALSVINFRRLNIEPSKWLKSNKFSLRSYLKSNAKIGVKITIDNSIKVL